MASSDQDRVVLPGQEQPAGGVREPAKSSEILDAAAVLIEPDGRWTQGVRARDGRGHMVEPDASEASCWCIVGAVQRVSSRRTVNAYSDPALAFVQRAARSKTAGLWNDSMHRTQGQVVAKLREAAVLARSEGQ